MAIADKRGIPGAIIIGIIATSIIAWIFGIREIRGVVGSIPILVMHLVWTLVQLQRQALLV